MDLLWPSRPSPAEKEPIDILVFCDGTGKNGRVDESQTNVYRLYSYLGHMPTRKRSDQHRRRRKLLYIPGVGAESKGIPKYLAQVFGKTIVEMVIKAYMYISQHYQPGDNVCLFGYSRGAFVARKVAGLLHRIGVVGNEEELLDQWKRREKPVPWDQFKDTVKSVPVRCIGVWDTVGAIYSSPECEVKDLLGIPDSELSPNIQLALHVCAFHENRKRFRVTLFEPNKTTELKEIWFPGAHSDVGGGGEKPTHMPKISLIWMIGELREFLDIADEKLKYPLLAEEKPLDAYSDSPAWKRMVDKCENRLESQALTPSSMVHQTVHDMDAKVKAESPTGNHALLTLGKLITSIRWDLNSCLVVCNSLESRKRSMTMEMEKHKQNEVHQRRRRASLPANMSESSFPARSTYASSSSKSALANHRQSKMSMVSSPITSSPRVYGSNLPSAVHASSSSLATTHTSSLSVSSRASHSTATTYATNESSPSLPSYAFPPPYSPLPPPTRKLSKLAIPDNTYPTLSESPVTASPMGIKSADRPRLQRNNARSNIRTNTIS